jgi:hypothetical protein
MSDEEEPILDPEAFAEELEGRLRAADGIEMLARNGMTISVRVGANDLSLNLDTFYQAYTAQPAALESLATSLLRSLRSYDPARAAAGYAQVRERIFPMLKPIVLLAEIRDRKLPMIAYRPFLADLIIAYVVDEAASVAYISEQHLERWEISEHDLHNQAVENLRRRTDERGNYTTVGEGPQRLVIFNSQDGFDAARLLLPALLERWRGDFPGRMVIGVPSRDFLIIFSDADEQILANVAQQIQLDAANREHGLTEQLFTLESGQVREYEWE